MVITYIKIIKLDGGSAEGLNRHKKKEAVSLIKSKKKIKLVDHKLPGLWPLPSPSPKGTLRRHGRGFHVMHA